MHSLPSVKNQNFFRSFLSSECVYYSRFGSNCQGENAFFKPSKGMNKPRFPAAGCELLVRGILTSAFLFSFRLAILFLFGASSPRGTMRPSFQQTACWPKPLFFFKASATASRNARRAFLRIDPPAFFLVVGHYVRMGAIIAASILAIQPPKEASPERCQESPDSGLNPPRLL